MGWKNLDPARGSLPDDFPAAPVVVLVRPQMGENIGMAARAMLNCGMTEMRLVNPRDGWPSEEARANASGASLVIDSVKVFDTVAEAVADCSYVLATTARERDMVKPVMRGDDAAAALIDQQGQGRCAYLFGCERSGLENDELLLADALVTVPLNPNFSSLNLAQAVLLVAYPWFARVVDGHTSLAKDKEVRTRLRLGLSAGVPDENQEQDNVKKEKPATKGEIQSVIDHLVDELDEARFFSTPEIRPVMIQNITNMFSRIHMTQQESRTLHGIIKALVGHGWKRK